MLRARSRVPSGNDDGVLVRRGHHQAAGELLSNAHGRVRQPACKPVGFREMHGNVWEWCEDGYAQSASSTQQASTGNAGARVLRGGGWGDYASRCRSANRGSYAPGSSGYYLGFRVARTSD